MKKTKNKIAGIVLIMIFSFFYNSFVLAGTGACTSPNALVNTLDPVPSNTFVQINDGAILTRFADATVSNVTYGASWIDGADNPAFSPCVTNLYAPAFGHTLSMEGTNIVYLRYRDLIGGMYITSQWIILDSISPTTPVLVSPADSSEWDGINVILEWENGFDLSGIGDVKWNLTATRFFRALQIN